jgi:hypothetical protein
LPRRDPSPQFVLDEPKAMFEPRDPRPRSEEQRNSDEQHERDDQSDHSTPLPRIECPKTDRRSINNYTLLNYVPAG